MDYRNAFDPSMVEKEQLLLDLAREVLNHEKWLQESAYPTSSLERAGALFSSIDFATGVGTKQSIRELIDLLRLDHHGQLNSCTFGIFTPAPAFPAILGDFLASALNMQLAANSSAPIANEIERTLVQWFGDCVGFPRDVVSGHLTTGGAESNLSALLSALALTFPQALSNGIAALPSLPRIYCSSASHMSWLKASRASGLGTNAIRYVNTDSEGRLDIEHLRMLIRSDRLAGFQPFFVVSNFGTTVGGIIDPVHDIAQICRKEDLFHHIDAAWGGAVCVSEKFRYLASGVELADSISIDPHKWLCLPFSAGLLLTRHSKSLAQAFGVNVDYFVSSDEANDPFANSAQWSRRFNGAKLYLVVRSVGRKGLGDLIEQYILLGQELRHQLLASGWDVKNNTPLPVICFKDPKGADAARICKSLWSSNRMFVTSPHFEGEQVVRASITNFKTTYGDISRLVSLLNDAKL